MNLQKYLDLEALTQLRRDLHQHPELGFEEIRTSRIVADYLLELGLEVEERIAETGVEATLRGEGRSCRAQGRYRCSGIGRNKQHSLGFQVAWKDACLRA